MRDDSLDWEHLSRVLKEASERYKRGEITEEGLLPALDLVEEKCKKELKKRQPAAPPEEDNKPNFLLEEHPGESWRNSRWQDEQGAAHEADAFEELEPWETELLEPLLKTQEPTSVKVPTLDARGYWIYPEGYLGGSHNENKTMRSSSKQEESHEEEVRDPMTPKEHVKPQVPFRLRADGSVDITDQTDEGKAYWLTRLQDEEVWLDAALAPHPIGAMGERYLKLVLKTLEENKHFLAQAWVSESADPALARTYLSPTWLEETPLMGALRNREGEL